MEYDEKNLRWGSVGSPHPCGLHPFPLPIPRGDSLLVAIDPKSNG